VRKLSRVFQTWKRFAASSVAVYMLRNISTYRLATYSGMLALPCINRYLPEIFTAGSKANLKKDKPEKVVDAIN